MKRQFTFLEKEDKYGVPYGFKNLYDQALDGERVRAYEFGNLDSDNKLDHLKNALVINTKINARTVFINGEILHMVKRICEQEGRGFEQWIKDNCDFSDRLARHFMNVYTHCLGHVELVLHVRPTILYEISSTKFTDELREWLLENADLSKISGAELKELRRKYKEAGGDISAVEQDIETIGRKRLIFRQIRYMLDRLEKTRAELDMLDSQIHDEYGPGYFSYLEEAARRICEILFHAIDESRGKLNEALNEVETILANSGESVDEMVA
jgi:hypothetical protein